MKILFNKIRLYIKNNKTISVVALIIIIIAGYWSYGKITSTKGEIRYVNAKVELGTIISTVTGSGQVSAQNQIDVKSKVSGDIIYLPVTNGQKVYKGTLIAQIDIGDAQKAIRDAQTGLESAKISLEKLKIQNSNENMNADLEKAYDDGFNTVSNVFLDLPTIVTGLNDIFYKNTSVSSGQWTIDWYASQVGNDDYEKALIYKKDVNDLFTSARKAYDKNFEDYKKISRYSNKEEIETLIMQTYETTKIVADSIKTSSNYIDFVKDSMEKNNFDIPLIINTHKENLGDYTSKTNSHLLNLLSIKTNIKNYKDAFPNANLDLQSSTLSVTLKENALQDAKDKLVDYYVRAPFDGTIATIAVKKSDTVSTNTSIATLITKKQISEITLNEVDVAKIKVGQKTTLTFDAIPDLSITGEVAEIDSIGTVSQGVVNYTVKISFDTQDDRIKPGMSTSATIITAIKQNVLVVSNTAVKTGTAGNYVETFSTALPPPTTGVQGSPSIIPPIKTRVETGLSNNTQTEIISGLKEGDIVVTKIISGTTTTTAPSILNSMGGNRAGGGNPLR